MCYTSIKKSANEQMNLNEWVIRRTDRDKILYTHG